jgi:hypothetical protein
MYYKEDASGEGNWEERRKGRKDEKEGSDAIKIIGKRQKMG